MSFSSVIFLFVFFPVVLLLFLCIHKWKNIKAENALLILSSVVFYAWGGIRFLLLLFLSVVINYFLGRGLEGKHKKLCFRLALIYDLGILIFFKYINFIFANGMKLLGIPPVSVYTAGLPLGISYFTFQILSYMIDAYRGKVKIQKNFYSLLLYVFFFPKVIAGPIVKYADMEGDLEVRIAGTDEINRGLYRFMIGFCKKIFLANIMGEVADAVFGLEGVINTGFAWMGILCYSLQIFMDSSSYADMAIGIGDIFGFHLTENFDYPYISRSVKEFWRRWHISLSSWFRDYVYIPLGGSRKGTFKTYRNLLIVFFLTGLWHGASWNFIVWGMFYGIFLIAERIGLDDLLHRLPPVVSRIYTLMVVVIGWVFFRADNLTKAWIYLKSMFGMNFGDYQVLSIWRLVDFEHIFFFVLAVLASTPLFKTAGNRIEKYCGIVPKQIVWSILFFCAVCFMMGSAFNPFIYFKF